MIRCCTVPTFSPRRFLILLPKSDAVETSTPRSANKVEVDLGWLVAHWAAHSGWR